MSGTEYWFDYYNLSQGQKDGGLKNSYIFLASIGLFKRKDGASNKPGMMVITSDEAASGDFGVDTKHKYSLKFSVTARNVFNQPNFTNFVGVQTSPFFRQPIAADNPRRIELGMRFSF